MSVHVLKRNAVWTQDGTHLGRCGRRAVEGHLIKDRGTLKVFSRAVGASPTGDSVVAQLEAAGKERGLPFVLMVDCGPSNRAEVVSRWCEDRKVVLLFSRPHTPQHNGASERGILEGKEESELGAGVRLTSPEEAAARLDAAFARLDRRPRATKGWRTTEEMERDPAMRHDVDRNAFFAEARALESLNPSVRVAGRPGRRATRAEIFDLLERHGLILRTRGGRPLSRVEEENIS